MGGDAEEDTALEVNWGARYQTRPNEEGVD